MPECYCDCLFCEDGDHDNCVYEDCEASNG